MSYLRWDHRPQLRRPVLVAAFEGWNDAGEAATTALRWLDGTTDAAPFATIDPEEFYDFTVARPHVRLDSGMHRTIEWPTPTFSAASVPGAGHDLVLLVGIEPALKWRSFTESVLEVATELGVETVLTLGALLADVPHTRPVRVTGTATDASIIAEMGFTRSRYEGPTGIVGVLMDACANRKLRSASLWATTPHYLRETQSPKAALALIERLGGLLDLPLDTTDLEIASSAYERQVNEMLSGEDDVADYVRRLEEDNEEDEGEQPFAIPPAETLAAEVEQFLRDQRRNGG